MLQVPGRGLNNRELDKLVAALGRSKATWRRALMLHDWLLSIGHHPDDRLCTTLIRHAQSTTTPLILPVSNCMHDSIPVSGWPTAIQAMHCLS